MSHESQSLLHHVSAKSGGRITISDQSGNPVFHTDSNNGDLHVSLPETKGDRAPTMIYGEAERGNMRRRDWMRGTTEEDNLLDDIEIDSDVDGLYLQGSSDDDLDEIDDEIPIGLAYKPKSNHLKDPCTGLEPVAMKEDSGLSIGPEASPLNGVNSGLCTDPAVASDLSTGPVASPSHGVNSGLCTDPAAASDLSTGPVASPLHGVNGTCTGIEPVHDGSTFTSGKNEGMCDGRSSNKPQQPASTEF